jgi:hypothetical protein
MRLKGWERALNATVARHAALPFSWHESNCLYFPLDVALAVTGEDPWADERGCIVGEGIRPAPGAPRFTSVADAFAARLPEIHPARMGRADFGVIEHAGGISGVVCLGAEVAGKPGADFGMIYLPRGRVLRAFKVG